MEDKSIFDKLGLSRLKRETDTALGAFSPLERFVFSIAIIVSIVAVLTMLFKIDDHFLVSIPANGGNLSEGVVGTPRFINPLLAITDVDHDITSLVYRGLMKKDGTGAIVPDLAESYTVSNDGLTYTFTLKDTEFQDGEKITADDVLFTIKSAEDSILKSPERIKWSGILIQAPDEKTVVFTLKRAYTPFLQNATLGILPKHIWSKIPYESWAYSDYNTKNAIGDGFFKIKSIAQNSSGIPSEYTLKAVHPKNEIAPRIDTISLHFFANEDALIAAYKNGTIDVAGGIDPENAQILEQDGATILQAELPRTFGLFFNQSQAKIFTDVKVRQAIALAIDKKTIVESVLKGYGSIGSGPIPDSSLVHGAPSAAAKTASVEQIQSILEKDGWKLGDDGIYIKQVAKKATIRLSFEIATNDTPELTQAVNAIAENLRTVGIEAIPKVYETGSLNQDIIRPRKFQALFFGEIISNQSDLYAFWHSSQRNDPGLNISGYANAKVDKLLEQGLSTLDPDNQDQIYSAFEKEITTDIPAVFVYSPSYIYVTRPELTGITLGHIDTPRDRFASINSWYLTIDRVWKIFAKNNN
jgi:peptide/nickel transport system substrate-binding protein